jgi:hypothetical protein
MCRVQLKIKMGEELTIDVTINPRMPLNEIQRSSELFVKAEQTLVLKLMSELKSKEREILILRDKLSKFIAMTEF